MLRGRALDNRAGCLLLIELLRQPLPYDMTFVFSVQEEIGLRGARTAAYTVAPQAALWWKPPLPPILRTSRRNESSAGSGAGRFFPLWTVLPFTTGNFRLACRTAEENGIPCQVKQAWPAGMTPAPSMFPVPGGSVSLPCRYLHSPVGMAEDLTPACRGNDPPNLPACSRKKNAGSEIFDYNKACPRASSAGTPYAGMAELADAPDLGSGGNTVQVQVLLPAPSRG